MKHSFFLESRQQHEAQTHPADLTRLLTDFPSPAAKATAKTIAHRTRDPLAGMTAKKIWTDCIWLSDEPTNVKIMLVCVGRFFDDNGLSSSMSYAQVARECGFSERTAKRVAKDVRDRWLSIEIGGGYLVPGRGHQNLYHAITAPELIERLREQKRGCHGVSDSQPDVDSGVPVRHPEGVKNDCGVSG